MTRPGPRGRQRAPSSSSTSNSSTMASGGIRRSGISAPGPSSDGRITKHRRLNPGVYEIGASPVDNRTALRRFNEQLLKAVDAAPFGHVMVIDGNDDRGIDVGLMTKFPVLNMRSHVDDLMDGGRVF